MLKKRQVFIFWVIPFLYLSNTHGGDNPYVPKFGIGNASNEKGPIITQQNSKVYHHTLKIGKITLGFSNTGGGYLNHVDLGDGKNICSPFYGRGWQHAIRDAFHGDRYNPTQAGFRDHEGTPVKVIEGPGKIEIPRFHLPLFSDPVYDFVQNEELIKEHPKLLSKYGKNRDADGLSEKGWSGDDEIRSEWDFAGLWEDASELASTGVPVARFRYYYAYVRPPKQVRQFGAKARRLDGEPVLNREFQLQDIAPGLPGKQRATEDDLSYGQFTFGLRLLTRVRDISTPWWVEKGKLVCQKKVYPKSEPPWRQGKAMGGRWVIFSDRHAKPINVSGDVVDRRVGGPKIDMPLMILSDGKHKDQSYGIGLYVPPSPINRRPIVGFHPKTLDIKYTDNRDMKHFFQGGQRVAVQYNLVERTYFTGMLAPSAKAIEALYRDNFLIFGSPEEIYRTAKSLEAYFLKRGKRTPRKKGG